MISTQILTTRKRCSLWEGPDRGSRKPPASSLVCAPPFLAPGFAQSGKSVVLALVTLALAMLLPAHGHTLFDFAGDAPKEGWRTNMWGKRDDGTKGTAEIAIVEGPNGGKALQASITDSPGCSIISPEISDGAWRQNAYEAIEITYRGDGSSNRVSFYLTESGKAPARAKLGLSLAQKTWQTLVLTPSKPAKDKPQLKLSDTTSLYFGCRNTLTFAIVSIRLLTEDDLRKIEEAKPAEQRAWEAAVRPGLRKLPGFKYVPDTLGLPRVLIIGDSISIHYTHFVRKQLEGEANVHRIPTNGGPTERGLASLDKWLEPGNWEVIYFNWGLHDSKYEGWDRKTGKRYSTPEAYANNLEQLVVRLKATGAKLVWGTTTPIPEGAKTHDVGDSIPYNNVANRIMQKHGIPVSDLYGLVKPDLAAHIRPRNIHFTPSGSEFLAKKVAKDILAQLQTAAK